MDQLNVQVCRRHFLDKSVVWKFQLKSPYINILINLIQRILNISKINQRFYSLHEFSIHLSDFKLLQRKKICIANLERFVDQPINTKDLNMEEEENKYQV